VTAEFRRLGKRGSYRLGQLRAQGVGEMERPVPLQPQFVRVDHRWPASVWLVAMLAGAIVIAGAAKVGWWFAPFVVGALAGVANFIGAWRARVAVPAIVVVAVLGWGLPLAWAELHGRRYGALARLVSASLGLPASAVDGFAVTVLLAVVQAVVGFWLGRALTPHRRRDGRRPD
jgi:hypothetical protein